MAKKKKGNFWKGLQSIFQKNPENVKARQEGRTKRAGSRWDAKTVKWAGKFDPLSVQARAGASAAWADAGGQAASDIASAYLMSQTAGQMAGAGYDPSGMLAGYQQQTQPKEQKDQPLLYAIGAAGVAVLVALLSRK